MSTTPEHKATVVQHPAGHRGTLRTSRGDELPVQTYDRGEEVVLVVLTQIPKPPPEDALDTSTLEYTSKRGIIRLQGGAVFSDDSLVHFHAEGEPEVIQRRSFVRVHAVREVMLGDGPDGCNTRTHTIDLSGGGMLLHGAEHLTMDETIAFEISFGEEQRAVTGVARVVRLDDGGRRALRFVQIDEDDRQRLIRFVFECMRAARAKTRGDFV